MSMCREGRRRCRRCRRRRCAKMHTAQAQALANNRSSHGNVDRRHVQQLFC